MKVSVIMPVYNAEKYIEQAIDSILNQSHNNLELIIGNDGSKDNTLNVVKTYKDQRIKVIDLKYNVGNQITTNILFSKAGGSYFAIQDADDWSDSNRLEQQLAFLKDNQDVGVVGSDIEQVSMENYKFPDRYHEFDAQTLNSRLLSYSELPFTWATVMFRRSVYEQIGGFREYFNRLGAADVDWIYRASFYTKLHILNRKLYFVRRHFNSFTKVFNADPRKLISSKIALHLFEQRINSGYDDLEEDPKKLDQWTKEQLREYYDDPSRIYYKYADTELLRKRPSMALPLSIRAFLIRPYYLRNVKQLLFLVLSIFLPRLLLKNI